VDADFAGSGTLPDVVRGDRLLPVAPERMPVVIVLDRLRSAYNVGNVFRLADAVRAEKIITVGYTATPPHAKLAKTARGCDETVPCEHAAAGADALASLKRDGYTVYGVETAASAGIYWEADVTFPAAFVFGNEALGISEGCLSLCDGFVSLPACGLKNSINVGNCAAVILFDALRRWRTRSGGDARFGSEV
jgi:tRNA G18 (ribose-2'-O)-methylase SpoU